MNLNKEQRAYLLNNLQKLKGQQEKLPAAFNDNFGPHLDEIISELENLPEDGGEAALNKKSKRLLAIFLETATKALEKTIIPGYAQRMITPASKRKYAPYLDQAKARRDMINDMLEQLNG